MNQTKTSPRKSIWKKIFIGILLVSVLANVAQYFMNKSAVHQLEKQNLIESNNQTSIFNEQIETIERASYDQLTRVFSWSVRSAILKNNFDLVDEYFSQMIQFDNRCDEINLYDMNGIIKTTTNLNLLDDPIQLHYEITPDQLKNYFSEVLPDSSTIIVHTPIALYNEIEYGLMIKYNIPKT